MVQSLVAPSLLVLLLSSIGVSALDLATPQHGPLALVLAYNVLDTADIMLRLAHVIQSGASRSLLPPLNDLDTLDVGTVDLVPHLDANAGQLVSQQDGRVDACAADVQAHARERVAGLLAYEQDVANVCAVWVFLAEEAASGAGWIEDGELGLSQGGDGLFACLCGGGTLGEDGDLLHSVFIV